MIDYRSEERVHAEQLSDPTALLVLEDGRVYRGTSFGPTRSTFGEAVFTTV